MVVLILSRVFLLLLLLLLSLFLSLSALYAASFYTNTSHPRPLYALTGDWSVFPVEFKPVRSERDKLVISVWHSEGQSFLRSTKCDDCCVLHLVEFCKNLVPAGLHAFTPSEKHISQLKKNKNKNKIQEVKKNTWKPDKVKQSFKDKDKKKLAFSIFHKINKCNAVWLL